MSISFFLIAHQNARTVSSGERRTSAMKTFSFDQFTRDVAVGLSRREALRRLGGGLAGTLLSFLGLGKAWGDGNPSRGNDDCAHFCQQLPPGPLRGKCVSDAVEGTGLCYECGPRGNNAGICGTTCCARPDCPSGSVYFGEVPVGQSVTLEGFSLNGGI